MQFFIRNVNLKTHTYISYQTHNGTLERHLYEQNMNDGNSEIENKIKFSADSLNYITKVILVKFITNII